ncbi:MAG: hypothetical protein NZ480_08340 [Bdellovibrionaceae bacterium]|nr:hypothetical protein [Pseudobdellovibrionaceae bacterium]MDW8190615.1 hypothetical protein [Pseudobdellovibrionaceae bacterium]
MKRLTPSQRLHFEQWKKQVFKGCIASEAFGVEVAPSRENERGIDWQAFLSINDKSPVL